MPWFEGDGTVVALFAMGVFGGSPDQGFIDASERIAVRTRRTSSAQILIGQYGAPGRTEDIEYGSWVGQFIIGFKLDTGATEIALIAKRNSFQNLPLLRARCFAHRRVLLLCRRTLSRELLNFCVRADLSRSSYASLWPS